MHRRTFLALPLGLAAAGPLLGATRAPPLESDELKQELLELSGDPKLARRALLLTPKRPTKRASERVLVLLHGLGEAHDERLGVQAWAKFYGLIQAYERLRRPPVERLLPKLRYFTDAHLEALNRSLVRRPFEGFAMVCPVTPNPARLPPAERTLDRYSEWLEASLLPAVRKRLDLESRPVHVGLDGCSMGGYVALEVFLRKPELFRTLGGVQSAFGTAAAARYASRLADALKRAGPRRIHLETSTQDPYRSANERLAKKLSELGVNAELSVLPGPHNQPWLREVGTLQMLVFHDRNLGEHT